MPPPPPHDLQALLREQEWVRRLAARLVGEGPDADDLAQEALTRALRHPRAPGEVRTTRGWLGTILRNLSRERFRADARRRAREAAAARPETQDDADALRRAELRRELLDLVLGLPEPERTTVVLHFLEELPYAAVAERTGVSVPAARQRVSRALRRLRERLDARGALPALAGLLRPPAPPLPPLAPPPSAAGPLSTLLLMSAKTKLLLGAAGAALLALVAAKALLPAVPSTPDESSPGGVATAADALDADGNAADARPEPAERDALSAADRRPEAAAPEPPTHVFVGRVVGAGRFPVEGATVSLPPGAENEATATTDAEGRFRLPLRLEAPPAGVVPAQTGLWARTADSRGAWEHRSVRRLAGALTETVEWGTLVLSPSFELDVRVEWPDGSPIEADVHVEIAHERLTAGAHRTDANGTLVLAGLQRGPVYVTARAAGYEGRATAFVPEMERVHVVLSPTRDVEVLAVNGETKEPIANAEILVEERLRIAAGFGDSTRIFLAGEYSTTRRVANAAPPTDPSGRTVIRGLLEGARYSLRASAPGFDALSRSLDAPTSPDSAPVQLQLVPEHARTVRCPITAADGPIPPDGSSVSLLSMARRPWFREEPPELVARIAGDELVAEGVVGEFSAHAIAPDGAIARFHVGEEESIGHTLSFRPPRTIALNVSDPEGSAVEGALVEVRNQGNNLIAGPVATDASGHVELNGLYGRLVDVYAIPASSLGMRSVHVGSVDLTERGAELSVTLVDERRRAVLRVFVDGLPQLPSRLDVSSQQGAIIEHEDPAAGELTILLPSVEIGSTATAWVRADGFRPGVVDISFESADEIPVADVVLARSGTLVAAVQKAPEARARIAIERLDEATGEYHQDPWTGSGLREPNGPSGTYVFEGLELGLWRVLDSESDLHSDPVELTADAPEGRVALDLDASAWVSGTVAVDDEAELARVQVFVVGPDADVFLPPPPFPLLPWSDRGGARLDGDRFRVRVPADEEVRILARHPWLVADEGSREVRVRGAQEGLELRLVSGDHLVLPASLVEDGADPLVARYAVGAAMDGEPLAWHSAALVEGVLRCAVPPGRWDLLVDSGDPWAPLVLEDVAIDGATRIAPPAFTRGSVLRVEIATEEGRDPPRISVFAERIGTPRVRRGMNSMGERVVELPGLGPGRWQVSTGRVMGSAERSTTTVEVDGLHPVTLPFDAR